MPGDTNGLQDVFVHDRITGQTERVSVSSTGTQADGICFSRLHSLSGDGRYVAFEGMATNLVPGDTNSTNDVFVRQLACEVGTPYCFGDGSAPPCPCGNSGASDAGCANSSGAGASLGASGSAGVAADDLELHAAQLLPFQPALLFAAQNATNGGAGLPFGDGLRCAGGGVLRLGVRTPDAGGGASWGPGLGAGGGWTAGELRRFQVWYRDPGGPCGSGFNLSNGVRIAFES